MFIVFIVFSDYSVQPCVRRHNNCIIYLLEKKNVGRLHTAFVSEFILISLLAFN